MKRGTSDRRVSSHCWKGF